MSTTTAPGPAAAPAGHFPAGLTHAGYVALRCRAPLPGEGRAGLAAGALAAVGAVDGVAIRGTYATGGYRADCDLLVWLAGPSADHVQDALLALRRSDLGLELDVTWSAIGVHREAEFNRAHVPAFFAGEDPRAYVCVYPFVRTPEWYLLAPERRRTLLADHGRMGRDYPDVRANTVSAFGLGDHEWLLAFEADDLTRIVDLIRHLRGAEARRYTADELPFFTGRRGALGAILAALP